MLFGAGMTTNVFTGPAANYTARIITPIDAHIVVDRMVTANGTYAAGAVQSSTAAWLMQVVAFRAAT